MRILITLSESDPDAWLEASSQEQQLVFEQHRAFDAAVAERGTLVEGAALAATTQARTVRTTGGQRVVTEGPFAETVEQLTGLYLVDLPDVSTAVELVHLLPGGYTIEVRPVVELEDY